MNDGTIQILFYPQIDIANKMEESLSLIHTKYKNLLNEVWSTHPDENNLNELKESLDRMGARENTELLIQLRADYIASENKLRLENREMEAYNHEFARNVVEVESNLEQVKQEAIVLSTTFGETKESIHELIGRCQHGYDEMVNLLAEMFEAQKTYQNAVKYIHHNLLNEQSLKKLIFELYQQRTLEAKIRTNFLTQKTIFNKMSNGQEIAEMVNGMEIHWIEMDKLVNELNKFQLESQNLEIVEDRLFDASKLIDRKNNLISENEDWEESKTRLLMQFSDMQSRLTLLKEILVNEERKDFMSSASGSFVKPQVWS
jgi:hypothetical protein